MNPVDYKVGQRVIISKENWQNIRNNNRSIHAYPDDEFVNRAYVLMTNQVGGTVTHRFPPGYECTVSFDNGVNLHMKDNWIMPMPECDPVDFMS